MTEQGRELPSPTAPLNAAKVFLAETCIHADALTLCYWRGTFWQHVGSHWKELSKDDIRRRLYEFTAEAIYTKTTDKGIVVVMPWLPNDRRISMLVDALKAACALPDDIEPGSWLDGRTTGTTIALRNGLLDLNGRTLVPHTPLFFNMLALPFDYDAEAKCPEWDAFMRDLWGDDDEPPMALQEAMGAAVGGMLDLHRILVLVGPPRAGKSLIASIFEALVGKANTTWPRLVGLAEDKTLSSLIGKSLCIIADMRATARRAPEIAEALLGISGGDSFTIDRKYKEAWIGRLPVMLVMVSNELPTIRDASGALPSRYLPLILTQSWQGREDRGLKARLMGELPGILNRALDGLDALVKRGQFTVPKVSLEAVDELADMASPMKRFVEERLIVAPSDAEAGEYVVAVDALLLAYNVWARENREEEIGGAMLGKRLRAVVPQLRRSQPRDDAEGRRTSSYSGIRLAQARVGFGTGGTGNLAELAARTGKNLHVIGGGKP